MLWLLGSAFAADFWVGPGMPYTLDDAVTSANQGDRILLLPGTYSGTLDGLDEVEIVGVGGAANTTIERPAPGVAIWEMGSEDGVLTGVTLDGLGDARPVFVGPFSELRAENSRFVNGASLTDDGGCILVEGHLELDGSRVEGCTTGVDENGGGIYVRYASMNMDQSWVADNTGRNGGGALCLGSACTIDRSWFFGNVGERGGALHLWSETATSSVTSSLFCGNTANIDGGAIRIRDSDVLVEASAFIENTAEFDGGHIDVWQSAGVAGLEVRHGMFVEGSTNIGDGAAIHVEDAAATVENSLFGLQYGSPDMVATSDVGTGTITASSSMSWGNFQGGAGVPGVVSADADLIDPDLCLWSAWTLGVGSPAIDAGTGTDLDGSPADLGVLGGPAPLSDADGDGARTGVDCDDDDPDVGPNLPEVCDGKDNDCDLEIDEGLPTLDWFIDSDLDGFGEGPAIALCGGFYDLAAEAGDCAPDDPDVAPGVVELCDGIDNDCDGSVDEDLALFDFYEDADGDGFGAGAAVQACQAPTGFVDNALDCDDGDSGISPDALEFCDGVDRDCDGDVDEDAADAFPVFDDADGDGFGAGAAVDQVCDVPQGLSDSDSDCDDSDGAMFPGADETCNGDDDDCDGSIDEDPVDAPVLYADFDGDGFGDPDVEVQQCPGGDAVPDDTDCDDTDPSVNPDAEEIPGNTVDEDCDGENELLYSDTDDPTETGEDPGDRRGFCGCSATGPMLPFAPLLLAGLVVRRRRD